MAFKDYVIENLTGNKKYELWDMASGMWGTGITGSAFVLYSFEV